MYNHFEFKNGGNPYITTNNAGLWRMIRKYCLEQTGGHFFTVTGKAELLSVRPLSSREKDKETLRNFAAEWQYNFPDMDYAWSDLVAWSDFFTEYGRKYGLLREFRENGIC